MNVSPRRALSPLFVLALLAIFAGAARAQESDVKKYNVDVRLDGAAHTAAVRTTLTVLNLTDAPKRQLQLRLNGASEVTSITLAGQAATYDVKDDKRMPGVKVVTVQLPAAIQGRATGDVTVESKLTLPAAAAGASILPGETVLLPSSLWFPYVNTPFIQYGANTAPFTLTATAGGGERAVSGGATSGSSFDQQLYGLPFVVTGLFEAPVAQQAQGISFEVWLKQGLPATSRAGADRLLADAAKIAEYYASVLGPPPANATFRIVATDRGAGFASSSGLLLATRAFGRPSTDADTYELLADALARVWVDGGAALRGAKPGATSERAGGVGIVRDAIPRYLAALAIGNRFGPAAEAEAFNRMRTGLTLMGDLAYQTQLSLSLPSDPSYGGVMSTRGPIALRIVEREVGRDKMLAAVRAALAEARTGGALTAGMLRTAIAKEAGRDLAPLYQTWLDTVVQPDLLIGVPQQSGSAWTSALRNLGTGDVTVDVVATTDSGKKVTVRTRIPSEGFGEARFETAEHIASVEVDPDKIYPQKDYSNDARPPRPSPDKLYVDGVELVKKKDFAGAEAKLRQAAAADPNDAAAKAWLARALLGLGRAADAEKMANDALATEPLPLEAAAWANNVLGQSALAAGRPKDAVDRFERAAAYAVESSALKAAHEGIIAAERAGGAQPPIDESVAKFFADFDRAVTAGVNTAQAEQYVDSAALPDFVKGLVTSVARTWKTEVLRAEMVGKDEALVDARFNVTLSQRSGTAFATARLRRTNGAWRISDIQILDTTETTTSEQ